MGNKTYEDIFSYLQQGRLYDVRKTTRSNVPIFAIKIENFYFLLGGAVKGVKKEIQTSA